MAGDSRAHAFRLRGAPRNFSQTNSSKKRIAFGKPELGVAVNRFLLVTLAGAHAAPFFSFPIHRATYPTLYNASASVLAAMVARDPQRTPKGPAKDTVWGCFGGAFSRHPRNAPAANS